MISNAQIADKLETRMAELKKTVGRGTLGTVEAAMHALRGSKSARVLTKNEIMMMLEAASRNEESALYMEDRGYPWIKPIILYGRPGSPMALNTIGDRGWLNMDEYGVKWRLWDRRPTGLERSAAKWTGKAQLDAEEGE